MKTIRKNAVKMIQEIARGTYEVKSYTLENAFSGVACEVKDDFGQSLFVEIMNALKHHSKLYTRGEGVYILRHHSNYWLEIKSAKAVA